MERYRGEDTGDLQEIELVEKWTCLNVLDKEIFEGDPKILTEEKSWRTWKSNQNIVMDEELVENVAMGEKSAKPTLIRKLRWIYPYSKLVDGKTATQ